MYLQTEKQTQQIRVMDRCCVLTFCLRMLRKLSVTLMFSLQRTEATKALRMKKVQELVNFMNASSERNEAVDISHASYTTVLNIISNILFSVDLGSYDSKQSNVFQETVIGAMEAAGKPDAANYFPFLGFLDLQGNRKAMKGCTERLFRIFRGFMDAKIAEKSLRNNSKDVPNRDFLDSLLALTKRDEAELDNNDIEHLLLVSFCNVMCYLFCLLKSWDEIAWINIYGSEMSSSLICDYMPGYVYSRHGYKL